MKLDFISYLKKNWFIFLISTTIGIFSHILWDDFTHANGYFVSNINFLAQEISWNNFTFPIYKILQQLSTIIGSLVIVFYFHQLPSNNFTIPKSKFPYWFVLVAIAFVIAMIRLFFLEELALGHLIVVSIASGLWSLMITGGLIRLGER